jgi:serine/threonine-protein kinase
MRKILIALGALIALVLFMDNLIMPLFVRRGQEFPLPDVTAMQEKEARDLLSDLRLELQVTGEEHSPARLEGTILSQEPPAGTMVKPGRPVGVVISKGGQMVRVPALAGVTVRQAALTLTDLGLAAGDIEWAHSDTLPPDVVISSTPEAGTLLQKGGRVQLVVNQGGTQDMIAMPNLVGSLLQRASTTLDSLGLELGVVIRQEAKDLLPETVLEQSEPAGEMVQRGEVIDVVIVGKEGGA